MQEPDSNHSEQKDIKVLMSLVKSLVLGKINRPFFNERLDDLTKESRHVIEALVKGPDKFGAYIVRDDNGKCLYSFKFLKSKFEDIFGRKPQNLGVKGVYQEIIKGQPMPILRRVFFSEQKKEKAGIVYGKVRKYKIEWFTITNGELIIIDKIESDLPKNIKRNIF